MSTPTRSASRFIRLAVVLILIAVVTVPETLLNARPAQAAPNCEMWALADRVDRQSRMYGAGGVNSCHAAVTLWINVYLYRDGKVVAEAPGPPGSSGPDCRSLPCAGSTGQVDMNGSHTWCTHVLVHFHDPRGSGKERQVNCTVT